MSFCPRPKRPQTQWRTGRSIVIESRHSALNSYSEIPELVVIVQPIARMHSNSLDVAMDRKEEIDLHADKCYMMCSKFYEDELRRPRRLGTADWLDRNFIGDYFPVLFIFVAFKGYSPVECR
jgi:hypothetical protein